MQLIVFFNRETFRILLEDYGENEGFRTLFSRKERDKITGSFDTLYFNTKTPNAIIYIDMSGKPEVDLFEQEKASKASILLIPDKTQIDYTPMVPLIVLRHNENPVILKNLTESNSIFQLLHQNEEHSKDGAETLYYKLVLFIGNTANITFDHFLKANNILCDPKLEAILNFLKDCLDINSISKNVERLIIADLNLECLKNKGIADLSDVRDLLLKQCQINNQSL